MVSVTVVANGEYMRRWAFWNT